MTTLNYAIVGTGMMGQEHLRNLLLVSDTTEFTINVVAIVDPDDDMRRIGLALAQRLGHQSVRACRTLDELPIASLDAVVLVSPNHTHHAMITELAESGLAILTEKPLCTTISECQDLMHSLQHYRAPIWVAMEYRYMPPTARFLERLKAGDVGRLKMLAIREHRYPFLPKVNNWNRFTANTGGTLIEKCCHHFDLMRLMTQAEPVRIYASGGVDVNHLDERYDGLVPDIIDNALVIVDFDDHSRAVLELCMFAEGAEPQEQLTAIGDKAKLDAFIPGPDRFWPDAGERHARVVLSRRDQSPPDNELIRVDPALAAAGDHHGSTYYQHVKFAQAVAHGAPVEVTLYDGMMAVCMGAAAQESIRTRQAVDFSTTTHAKAVVAGGAA